MQFLDKLLFFGLALLSDWVCYYWGMEKALTVAQACRHLGVSERTLRRLLAQPETQALTVAEHRRTVTGVRRAVMLSPELVARLEHQLSANGGRFEGEATNSIDNDGIIPAKDGTPPMGDVLAYERLLAEQRARIADLQAALAYERERSQALAEANAILQTEMDLLRPAKTNGVQGRRTWFRRTRT